MTSLASRSGPVMTFRRRIIVAMVPLFVLLVVLGGTGTVLIYRLGNGIDKILRENYDSVVAMRDLNEALERIDSSFQFALAGREQESYQQYQDNCEALPSGLADEQNNITLPGEGELVDRLTELTDRYRQQGDDFFKHAGPARGKLYFGEGKEPGLYGVFRQIKDVSGEILRINQDNMEDADEPRAADGPLLAALVRRRAGLRHRPGRVPRGRHDPHDRLYPIRAVTESAAAIGAGNLDQLVPVSSDDELGQLAAAFNTMARQLRDYRQSHKAQLIRAQQTSQATIDSFPDPVLVVDRQQRVELANPVGPAAVRRPAAETRQGGAAVRSGSRPSRCGSPWPTSCENQREYLPEGFDKAIVAAGRRGNALVPAADPADPRRARGRRSGPPCSWKTSPASACSTR